MGEPPPIARASAYGSGPVRANLAEQGHTAIIKPWPLGRNPNLGADQFRRDDFVIDYAQRTVTCPAGQTVAITTAGNAVFGWRCATCPSRHRCTSAKDGKTFKTTEHDELLAAARSDWRAGTNLADYRQHRPMVERAIAWLVANGNRRVRFRGVERNRLGLSHRAAALNLRRLLILGLHHGPTGWAIT